MKKMLVIDDNIEFRNMISDYFSEFGFEVIQAENGEIGLETARKISPDIIFLDVMMPDKSGIEVLRELQTDENTVNIPVMVITGTYFEKTMNDLFLQESNCRGFISKATDISAIQKKVEEIIPRK